MPQWWALRVNVGREKQTCTNIERRYQQLREAAEAQGEAEGLQEIETWDVWKRVRAWNPKSQKMGNKMVRYEGGGWVLVRAIMDSRIASIISGNINILGYHHREVFEGEEFPVPADSELISALTAWQEDLREITEEEVREELGLGPKPDDVDFDDFEDYGRARGRDSSGSRDRDRGRRTGERSGGLFSSHGSGEAWYGGMSSGDEDRQFDTFDDTVGFGTSEENEGDAMNEFGAWLGDFKADAGGDDWMGAAMNDEAETEMGIENRDTGKHRGSRAPRRPAMTCLGGTTPTTPTTPVTPLGSMAEKVPATCHVASKGAFSRMRNRRSGRHPTGISASGKRTDQGGPGP